VICVSCATRDELVRRRIVDPRRVRVVHNAVDSGFSPLPNPAADREIERLLGPPVTGVFELLHVGSTAPRKRLDVLLEVTVNLRRRGEPVRLIRVGPPLSGELRSHAGLLAARGAFQSLPFLSLDLLAALYRRAFLLLHPSDAEGFGLPVAEAMACGLTVLASDLPVLREVGGSAAHYCPPGNIPRWTAKVSALLQGQRFGLADVSKGRQVNLEQASRFSLHSHAAGVVRVYEEVTKSAWAATDTREPHGVSATL
jgi:glycosyltransferase involved in cell wall biosynthesis